MIFANVFFNLLINAPLNPYMLQLKSILVILLLLPTLGYAQVTPKLLQIADGQFQEKAYARAIETYETFFQKQKKTNVDVYDMSRLNLATSYFFVKNFEKAEKNYREVLSKNIRLEGEDLRAYLRYAQTLSANGKHQEASTLYEKYTSLQAFDSRGTEFVNLYNNIDALSRNASSYQIEYLGLNTDSPDFSPAYYKKGLVFVSGRGKNSAVKRVFSWDNSPFLDLFIIDDLAALQKSNAISAIGSSALSSSPTTKASTPIVGDDHYTPATANDANIIMSYGNAYISGDTKYVEYAAVPAKRFSRTLNSKYHEGPCAFYHTIDKIIFTRNNKVENSILENRNKNISRLKLYTAVKKGNGWQEIEELPFNNDGYSCGHPSLTTNDKVLYFVSDMPGGYGGTDIYLVRFTEQGWSKPINLGGRVNTPGNEMFPYVDEHGGLYFSTDGLPGLGGLDLFFVSTDSITQMPIGKARNLGAPLNSTKDDFGILTDGERKTGYFSTNRKRGNLDDDIYRFERLGPLYGCREVSITVWDNNSKKPLPNTRFKFINSTDSLAVQNVTTNISGKAKLCLEADNEFIFTFQSQGYEKLIRHLANYDASDYEPTVLDIYLKPIIVKEEEEELRKMIIQRRERLSPTVFRGIITDAKGIQPIVGAKLKFTNLCSGLSQEYTTKADGSYEFERDIACSYELIAQKDGFAVSKEIIPEIKDKAKTNLISSIFQPKNEKNENPNETYRDGSLFDTKLYRVGDVVKLNNIYYESSDWKLNKTSEQELDRLIATLNRYPNMIVEIRSHTDSRGNAAVNLALSQRRVEAVVKYLEKNKIDSRRIKGLGMGESQPLNQCGDGVRCTETEYQQNRRTEFRILQIEKIF